MYCPKCGKELPNGAAFCGYCGNAVTKESQPDVVNQSANTAIYQKRNNPIVLGAIAVVAIIAIVIVIGFGGKSNESTNGEIGGNETINYTDAYSEVLKLYKDCVQKIVVEKGFVSECPWGPLYDVIAWGNNLTSDDFGYAFYDINKNGTKELILYTRDFPMVLGIYSLQNGEPFSVRNASTYRNGISIKDDGIIVIGFSSGASNSTTAAYTLSADDSELTLVEEYGVVDEKGTGVDAKHFRGFGGERTYYDVTDSSFKWEFESDISMTEANLEFESISIFES